VQRTSMLGQLYLTQSERSHSTTSIESALLQRLVSPAPEAPLVERGRMQRLMIPRLLGWC